MTTDLRGVVGGDVPFGVCLTPQEGRLKSVKGLGWFLDDLNMAQISMNLTDFETTPVHVAYEECCKDAKVGWYKKCKYCIWFVVCLFFFLSRNLV